MSSDIGKSLKKINNLIKRDCAKVPARNVNRLRGWILEYLTANEGRDVYQRDLETELCVRRSTITEVLNNMERDGLVRRASVGTDKRLKKITLTEKSEEFRLAFKQRIDHIESVMSEGIDAQDLELFKRVIEKITNNLEKHFCQHKE